jgi:hypothetical protein
VRRSSQRQGGAVGAGITLSDTSQAAIERLRGDLTRRIVRVFGAPTTAPQPLVSSGHLVTQSGKSAHSS